MDTVTARRKAYRRLMPSAAVVVIVGVGVAGWDIKTNSDSQVNNAAKWVAQQVASGLIAQNTTSGSPVPTDEVLPGLLTSFATRDPPSAKKEIPPDSFAAKTILGSTMVGFVKKPDDQFGFCLGIEAANRFSSAFSPIVCSADASPSAPANGTSKPAFGLRYQPN